MTVLNKPILMLSPVPRRVTTCHRTLRQST